MDSITHRTRLRVRRAPTRDKNQPIGEYPSQRREAAAMMVSAIALQATPEGLIDRFPDVLELWADPLERVEALAHVDLLLGVLLPRGARP